MLTRCVEAAILLDVNSLQRPLFVVVEPRATSLLDRIDTLVFAIPDRLGIE